MTPMQDSLLGGMRTTFGVPEVGGGDHLPPWPAMLMLMMNEVPSKRLGVGSAGSRCIFLFLMFSYQLRPFSFGNGGASVTGSPVVFLQLCWELVRLVYQLIKRKGVTGDLLAGGGFGFEGKWWFPGALDVLCHCIEALCIQ